MFSEQTKESIVSNPYQSPKTATDVTRLTGENPTPKRRWLKWYRLIAWAYPPSLLLSFFVTWLVAWGMLGHIPRPNYDDPGSIGWPVDASSFITGILLVGMPGASLVGIVIEFIAGQRKLLLRIASCLALAGVWTLAICFLQWDPFDVVLWFFD